MNVHIVSILAAATAIISSSLLLSTAGMIVVPVYAQDSHEHPEGDHGNDDGGASSAAHQMEHSMNMDMDMNTTNMTTGEKTQDISVKSPFLFNDTTSDMRVKVSWEPNVINTKVPTKFTFEFFNSTTGDRLSNVTYSLHVLLDGRGLEHGHETSAPKGIGTFEYAFDSKGLLSLMIESIKVAKVPTDAVVQLNIPVAS